MKIAFFRTCSFLVISTIYERTHSPRPVDLTVQLPRGGTVRSACSVGPFQHNHCHMKCFRSQNYLPAYLHTRVTCTYRHTLTCRQWKFRPFQAYFGGWGCSSVGKASDRHVALRRFDSPVRQGIFLLRSTFSADCLTVSVQSRIQSHVFTSVRTLKIPWSMSEFGGLWKH